MYLRHVLTVTYIMACGGGETITQNGFANTPLDDEIIEGATNDDFEGDAPDEAAAPDPLELDDKGPLVPYNRAIQKSIHNAYERHEPLLDQLVYHRVRSLELDIHVRRDGARAPRGDWFVFHEDTPTMRATSCAKLSDCLGQIEAFRKVTPRHEVITVFLDLKSAFEDGHEPSDLDEALVSAFDRNDIVAPADLLTACPGATTLRDAVTGACAFPTLHDLRGKLLFVVTGGSACRDSRVMQYGGADPRARLAFVGAGADGSCTVESYDARPNIVFLNLPLGERARATEVQSRGLVARVYVLNTPADFASARMAGAVHLATDKVNFERDPWSISHGPRGFPFACDGCEDDLAEPGSVLGLDAVSGDQWAEADSGMFAYEIDDDDATWSALISVPSSHVEPFAKACLVARASHASDAANVAVCRMFDTHAPRFQLRQAKGAVTTSVLSERFPNLSAESGAFFRLSVKKLANASEVTAAVSASGTSWTTIATTTLAMPLPIRGISVSSHGPSRVKGIFANLTKNHRGKQTRLSTATLERRAVGAGVDGSVFDELFAP